MRSKTIMLTALLVMAISSMGAANDGDKLTVDLFLDWESVSNPAISPDGQQIVYTRRWTDKVNDKYVNEIWKACST